MSVRGRRILEALLKWFGFAVIVGALPVIISAIDFAIRKEHLSVTAVLKSGDLSLVSVVLLGAALCDLPLKSLEGNAALARTVSLVAAVILVVLGIIVFVDVSSLIQDKKSYDESLVAYGSLGLFGLSFLTAGSCVALGEAFAPPSLPGGP